jgi:hypothetical protein
MKVEKGKKSHKWTAGWVVIAFIWMMFGINSPAQLKAGTAKGERAAAAMKSAKSGNPENNAFEKEGGKQEIVKKKKFPWFLVAAGAVLVGIVVYFTLIKPTKHILVVEIGPGASGIPAAGKYTYKKGEKIAYNFTCAGGYKNLTVFVDDKVATVSGTIVMDRAHRIRVETIQLAEFPLFVHADNGIIGSPVNGSYQYREGTTVPYHYSAADLNLVVKLDDVVMPVSGSFVMDKNHILQVSFGPPPDIRGTWSFQMKGSDETQAEPQFAALFSGMQASGTFRILKDPINPYWSYWLKSIGKYQISSNSVSIDIYDGGTQIYNFGGMFASSDTISGNVTFSAGDPPRSTFGTWTAIRIK